jgi:hypothetical protein
VAAKPLLNNVLPVLLTCARHEDVVEQFVASYRSRVGGALPPPVVVIDLTASLRLSGTYYDLVQRLSPAAVHLHLRPPGMTDPESINDAAFCALACGLAELGPRDYLLFLEDDIVFSSEFVAFLFGLQLEPDAGFYTLYLPGGGYGAAVIEPYRFYGTQCVLFPREAAALVVGHRREMEERFSPNYDLRWAQFLGSRGYKLYAAPRSYVQHTGVQSRLGSNFHSSCRFVA